MFSDIQKQMYLISNIRLIYSALVYILKGNGLKSSAELETDWFILTNGLRGCCNMWNCRELRLTMPWSVVVIDPSIQQTLFPCSVTTVHSLSIHLPNAFCQYSHNTTNRLIWLLGYFAFCCILDVLMFSVNTDLSLNTWCRLCNQIVWKLIFGLPVVVVNFRGSGKSWSLSFNFLCYITVRIILIFIYKWIQSSKFIWFLSCCRQCKEKLSFDYGCNPEIWYKGGFLYLELFPYYSGLFNASPMPPNEMFWSSKWKGMQQKRAKMCF